ncbi:hypothetical protein BTM25_39990 [Actinomadura rubteroloni]|uniref:Uncharacterized protein n=1 Tax=Actinomadura rubteroloni TaxID=1926885 RepID=A0A2P4UJW7_9ACTN|nr:hypothetical protein [Actinomadura rubteroloni]POM25355.1 hypothetical protein BTM25_39990 [Actinomadura rubteroloni]
MGYPGDHGVPGGRTTDRGTPAGAHESGPHGPEQAPFFGAGDEQWRPPQSPAQGAPWDGGGTPPLGAPPVADDLGTPVAGQATRTFAAPSGGFAGGAPEAPQQPSYEQPYQPQHYEQGAFGHPSDEPVRPAPPSGGKGRTPLVVGASAAACLVLVGVGYFGSSLLKDDDAKPSVAKTPQAAPTRRVKVTPPVPPLDPVKLRSRATDPKPLTLREVFAKRTFTAGGQKYTRTAWNAGKCATSVGGPAFAVALKKAGCSQALRATFSRKDGKLIGTVGIFNLRTEKAAKYAERASAVKAAHLVALPGAGLTAKIGKGEALGSAQVKGHYLVLTWVQRPDGKKIPTTYNKVVTTFGQQVIKGSNLSFALAYRETEGRPFRN